MARKCSSCGNNGHNSRTCSGHRGMEDSSIGGDSTCCGLRLFGVQLQVGSSSSLKKCLSMKCLSPATYYGATAVLSTSPSVSPPSSLVSIELTTEQFSGGYLSDGLIARAHERKKGVPWTEEEHRMFLVGLENLGKGDWRGISRHFVVSRTPTQVASHAQKYFLRQCSLTQKKRRSSLFDAVVGAKKSAIVRTSVLSEVQLKEAVRPPPCLNLLRNASTGSDGVASQAPCSSLSLMAQPQVHLKMADLELKMSTSRLSDQAGPSPSTPFFGTIRVT
ncbi:transcription factor MYBS3 [Lolium perenne]|uniref:transcription factor MYBS3 n=1 Tax=Lolium perenne TaxID=4522 RepID=UPI0021F679F6|nr:transcription factor MYBS3-like [Lolium perenne]